MIGLAGRVFVLAAALLWGSAAGPWTATAMAEALTEERVVALARARMPAVRLALAESKAARGAAASAGLHPNPSVGWSREAVPGTSAVSGRQDDFTLTLPLALGGRRPVTGDVAEALALETEARAKVDASAALGEAVMLFYEGLAEERRHALLVTLEARWREAARVLERRVHEGLVAATDLDRLTLERVAAESGVRRSALRMAMLRQRLGAVLGERDPKWEPSGELRPPRLQGPLGTNHAVEKTLGAARSRAEDARDGAGWSWAPGLSVTGGVRLAEAGDRRTGYLLGISVDVPLFDHGQGTSDEAVAAEERASATQEALTAQLAQMTREGTLTLELVEDELRTLDDLVQGAGDRLSKGAEARYQEGSVRVVEFVDAMRAVTELHLRRVEVELEARRAHTTLRHAAGEFMP